MVDRAISLNFPTKTRLSGSDFANGVLEKQFLKYLIFWPLVQTSSPRSRINSDR